MYEGSSDETRFCKPIVNFEVSGLPPRPRGLVQIEVTFDINRAGVLTVEARDTESGAANRVTHTLTSLEFPTAYYQ